MQFQRQSVWVFKKCHMFSSKLIRTDWFTFNPPCFQLLHCLVYTCNMKSQVPQSTSFISTGIVIFLNTLQTTIFSQSPWTTFESPDYPHNLLTIHRQLLLSHNIFCLPRLYYQGCPYKAISQTI